ncbi:MAG TPA: PQQ-binding-like beta-propeller repeat protein [Blastocatellia bacterium]|nr:PQQ-binding-like beta-propeller repeat protein [Blastocatellia bacterium]
MKALILSIAILGIAVFGIPTSNAFVAQPTISSLSAGSLSRSGRLLINGTGFGAAQGTGRVEIAGLTAPVTWWSDTLVVAYVLEATPVGSGTVRIVNEGGASNQLSLNVTLRPAASGQVKWRFQADAPYILHRPAVGPDGTVYVYDALANLYALTPDGGLKWIFKAGPVGYLSEVSVGADGTVYVAGGAGAGNTIFAVNPDGTEKWRFSDPSNQGLIAGPNVGADGKIYAVFDMPGLGAVALSAAGQLQWNVAGFNERGPVGEEIGFGAPGQFYFSCDMGGTGQPTSLFGFGFDGRRRFQTPAGDTSQAQAAVASEGTVYLRTFISTGGLRLAAFDPGGTQRWTFFNVGTNDLTDPGVGTDGVVYIGQNLFNLFAVNPNGTQKWKYTDAGILFSPMASPLNDLVLMGGRVDYGQPGFFLAVSTAGRALWRVDLPMENGANIIPYSRPRFAPDGRAAYIGTAIPGQNQADEYCYVYALQTAAGSTSSSLSSVTLNPIEVIGGSSSLGTISLTGPAPAGGARVTLSSDDPLTATPPISATVPAGSTSATFSVTTSSVSAMEFVNLAASYLGASKTATLIVSPAIGGPSLSSLTLNPTSVQAGGSAQATVALASAAPSGGAVVSLSSSNGSVATTPATVTVPAGATSATFTVTSGAVLSPSSATITATLGTATRSATLNVTPPPPADTVAIQQALWVTSKRQLRVSATSTNAAASLSVYATSTGQLLGALTNDGAGSYSVRLRLSSNPQNITVRSTSGGSASKAVNVK